ncbi:MAG: outer membrane beta-barrel protein [Candidatus Nitrosocosmicus sp.]
MKRNKLYALSIGLLCSLPANASDWLYAGVGFGMTATKAESSYQTTANRFEHYTTSDNTNNYGVFLGYHYSLKETPLFVRLELGAQSHPSETSHEDTSYNVFTQNVAYLRTNSSLLGLFKMGVSVKDLMFYGTVGISKTNWKINIDTKDIATTVTKNSLNITKYGRVFGFGAEYKVNPNWAIGLDHTYTEFASLKLTVPAGNVKMEPKIHTTTFRLTYVF